MKKKLAVLHLAYSHPKTPFAARFVIGLAVGYALSPIDLIPDFIPVIGYLDDLLIVPAGIYLAMRLIPPEVVAECEKEAEAECAEGMILPACLTAAVLIALIWAAAFFAVYSLYVK